MTSLSRKNRPITLRRIILRATAISLAWLGVTGAADAQAPSQGYRPIATNTTPFPATPIAQTPTRPLEVPPAAAIGTRVLMPGQPANPNIVRVQSNQPTAKVPAVTPFPSVETLNVFRLINDTNFNNAMLSELDAERLAKWEKETKERVASGLQPSEKPKALTVKDDLPTSAGLPKSVGQQSRQDPSPLWLKVEPSYVVHRRLMFEDKNSERYGWELGIAQPAVSAAYFAKDLLLWPSHLASSLFERYDTSAGKCPPGSPVPYLLYPPEITAFGGTVGAAVIVGTAILIP